VEKLGETRQEKAPAMTLVVRGGTGSSSPSSPPRASTSWHGATPREAAFPQGRWVTEWSCSSTRRTVRVGTAVVRADLLETVELAGAALIIAVEAWASS